MKCIVCGKPAEIESFCSDCWLKNRNLFEIHDFEIRICECSSILLSGQWKKFDNFNDAARDVIEKKVETKNKIKRILIDMNQVGNIITASVVCSGLIKPCKKEKTESRTVRIKIRTVKCEECKKHLASYYEAVIQLRVPELVGIIEKEGGESVIRIAEVRGGYDIFMFRDNVAKQIAGRLRKKGYSITKSNVFVVEKNNKKIYRNYYSVKTGDKNRKSSNN